MKLLLDTCAVIYRAEGEEMSAASKVAIDRAAAANGILISPVCAWEVGLLCHPERRKPLKLSMDADIWIRRVMEEPGAVEAPLTYEIALHSTRLPGDFHRDPADRFLMATARVLNVPIVTRDEVIEAYAKAGHVQLIKC